MRFSIALRPFHLKVLSSLLTDITAGWVLGLLAVRDFWSLTGNLLGVTVSLYLVFKIEKLLEEVKLWLI